MLNCRGAEPSFKLSLAALDFSGIDLYQCRLSATGDVLRAESPLDVMPDTQKIIDDLKLARDEVKLRIHLASMDAQSQWEDLETLAQVQLQGELHQSGKELSTTLKVQLEGRLRPLTGGDSGTQGS